MAWLNLAAWVPCTEVEGPGRRAALWVQGCTKRCAGCCNPGYLKIQAREIVEAETVLGRVLEASRRYGLEGVTLLGGEPFLQAQGLAIVATGARKAGMSVIIFTGFTFAELRQAELPATDLLLRHTDVLVDGPYEQAMPDTKRNWVGSANQRFHYLSDRYDTAIEGMQATVQRSLEVRAASDGRVMINGWPVAWGQARGVPSGN